MMTAPPTIRREHLENPARPAAASSDASRSRRVGIDRYDALAIVTVVSFLLVYIATAATVESYGSDTSTYFGLAESLRHDHRYWFDFQPHTVYPPGYPLLLAGLMSLVGDNFGALVKLSVPIYFVGLLGVYWLIKTLRGPRTAFIVVLLSAVSSDAYYWTTVGLHSDVSYLTVSILALCFAEFGERATRGWHRAAAVLLLGISAAYLLMLRSIGLSVALAIAAWMFYRVARSLVRRRDAQHAWRRAARWLPALLFPIAVQLAWSSWTKRQAALTSADDYMQTYTTQILKADPHQVDSPQISLTELPARAVKMLGIRTANALRMVLNAPPIYLSWYSPILIPFLVLVGWGFAVAWQRGPTLLEFYMLTYGGVLVIHPFDEGTRFLLVIQPFIVMYAIDGLSGLRSLIARIATERHDASLRWLGGPAFGAAQTLLLLAIMGLGIYKIAGFVAVNRHPDPTTFHHAATVDASHWIAANTKSGDVIMNEEHAILHRLTGRKTLRFPLTTDPTLITKRIVEGGVDFVVVMNQKPFEYFNPSAFRRFETVKSLAPDLFVPVHVFAAGTIYRVRKRGEKSNAARAPSLPSASRDARSTPRPRTGVAPSADAVERAVAVAPDLLPR